MGAQSPCRLRWTASPAGSVCRSSARGALALPATDEAEEQEPVPGRAGHLARNGRQRAVDPPLVLEAVLKRKQCTDGPLTTPVAPSRLASLATGGQRHEQRMGYAAFVGQELVALLDWGAAVLRCLPRDQFVAWDKTTRERNLHLVVGNRRFLVLPWIRIAHLASKILAANLRRLSRHPVLLAETFVDPRFKGTCYRAANWVCLGQTLGETYTRRDGTRARGCPKGAAVQVIAGGTVALCWIRACASFGITRSRRVALI